MPNQGNAHDDVFGILGDIRVFSIDGVEWRAFEYRSPGHSASETQLVLIADARSYAADRYPADWYTLAPEKLAALARDLPPRAIRRSTPERGSVPVI